MVVVGVDGSSSSHAAVVQAAREAERRGAELRVVHAFSWPVGPMYAPLDTSPLNTLAHDAAQDARRVAPGVKVGEAVMIGGAVSVLVAESRAADLVVVGRRGIGGFVGMLLGSTAVSLAAHSRCPVLVVREEPDCSGPVVLAVDGSPEGEKAVEFAFAEAELRGAELVAVHAWLPDHAPAGTGVESPERLLGQAVAAGRAESHPDVTVRQEVLSGETRSSGLRCFLRGPRQVQVRRARVGRRRGDGLLLPVARWLAPDPDEAFVLLLRVADAAHGLAVFLRQGLFGVRGGALAATEEKAARKARNITRHHHV
ncbi:universal stress protein [Streptomyces sp. Ru62]|uniref:universal stress protein n=1 Tax=Streptomyces sp. Ru62 TaxID=2080745 RepID=UPI0021566198|nr:universal stress protein [Streptomyces sp. Ru62]